MVDNGGGEFGFCLNVVGVAIDQLKGEFDHVTLDSLEHELGLEDDIDPLVEVVLLVLGAPVHDALDAQIRPELQVPAVMILQFPADGLIGHHVQVLLVGGVEDGESGADGGI